jgi:hypothetical protein
VLHSSGGRHNACGRGGSSYGIPFPTITEAPGPWVIVATQTRDFHCSDCKNNHDVVHTVCNCDSRTRFSCCLLAQAPQYKHSTQPLQKGDAQHHYRGNPTRVYARVNSLLRNPDCKCVLAESTTPRNSDHCAIPECTGVWLAFPHLVKEQRTGSPPP